jgi:hypothetical protein
VIEKLNKESVGVPEVEGPGAVAMRLHRLLQVNAMSHDAGSHFIDIFRSAHNEPNVMNALGRAGVLPFGKPVNREIIAPGGEINIVRVGLPFDLHPEDIAIEVDGVTNTPNVESNMPKT